MFLELTQQIIILCSNNKLFKILIQSVISSVIIATSQFVVNLKKHIKIYAL